MPQGADNGAVSERELRPLDEDAGADPEVRATADGTERGKKRKKWRRVADPKPMSPMDADVYSTKKTVAQGFMDLALLSANADQLRTLVKTGDTESAFFVLCVVLLSVSIFLQVLIAVGLLLKGRYNINKPRQFRAAETVNNCVMVASVLLTAVNVLATSFTSEVPLAAHVDADAVAKASRGTLDAL